jgi:hypothetical protein
MQQQQQPQTHMDPNGWIGTTPPQLWAMVTLAFAALRSATMQLMHALHTMMAFHDWTETPESCSHQQVPPARVLQVPRCHGISQHPPWHLTIPTILRHCTPPDGSCMRVMTTRLQHMLHYQQQCCRCVLHTRNYFAQC